jgi:hypothetical protein
VVGTAALALLLLYVHAAPVRGAEELPPTGSSRLVPCG